MIWAWEKLPALGAARPPGAPRPRPRTEDQPRLALEGRLPDLLAAAVRAAGTRLTSHPRPCDPERSPPRHGRSRCRPRAHRAAPPPAGNRQPDTMAETRHNTISNKPQPAPESSRSARELPGSVENCQGLSRRSGDTPTASAKARNTTTQDRPTGRLKGPGVLANPALMSVSIGCLEQRSSLARSARRPSSGRKPAGQTGQSSTSPGPCTRTGPSSRRGHSRSQARLPLSPSVTAGQPVTGEPRGTCTREDNLDCDNRSVRPGTCRKDGRQVVNALSRICVNP